ncbi:MAG: MFS transporter [Candidatus Rokubacteria bacterium]|nr:MFS transporter [Candidatus Rokubacteria bacterium]
MAFRPDTPVSEARESLASGRLWLGFACMLLVSGLANTFPVFLPALLHEFGGSRAATASAITLLWIGGAILGPLTGWLVSRWNPRAMVMLGLTAAAIGLAAGALAPTLAAFVLSVGIGAGIGVGLTGMVPQAAILADAYVARRGIAMGIAFSGSMAGYVVAPPVQWAIAGLGWRAALLGYVAAVLALLPVAWRVLPRRLGLAGSPRRGGAPSEPTVREVVASLRFWVLAVLFATPPLFGYLATTQHALYFAERGFSAVEASALLGAGGVLAAGGRVLFGLMADRLGAPLAGFLSFGSSLLGLGCLFGLEAWPIRSLAWAYAFFLFLPMGSRATIVSVLVTRVTPPAHYGVIFGLVGIGNNLGAAAGPALSGALHDWTGSYLAVYLAAAGVLLVGLVALGWFAQLTSRAA